MNQEKSEQITTKMDQNQTNLTENHKIFNFEASHNFRGQHLSDLL